MNLKTIEAQLIEQADKELTKRIDDLFLPVYNATSSQCSPILMAAENGGTVAVRPYIAWAALKKLAFDMQVEQNRQNALNAFMDQVSNLTSQLEELKSQIR